MPTPRQTHLTAAARTRLTHVVELNDVFSPSDAARWAGQLAREPHILNDLCRVRPWLSPVLPGTRREALGAVLAEIVEREWTGFLTLLGEYGPWVYAPSVADLQELSRHYAALVLASLPASEQTVLEAAQQLQQTSAAHRPEELRTIPGQSDPHHLSVQFPQSVSFPPQSAQMESKDYGSQLKFVSLLARLEATDYRQPQPRVVSAPERLAELERAFWHAAEAQARRRVQEWEREKR